MPSPTSSNRYSPLEKQEVRIEMENTQIQQSAFSHSQDSACRAESLAVGVTLPPPVGLETQPLSGRGMDVNESLEEDQLHEEFQKETEPAPSLPEVRERPSLIDVSLCVYNLRIVCSNI